MTLRWLLIGTVNAVALGLVVGACAITPITPSAPTSTDLCTAEAAKHQAGLNAVAVKNDIAPDVVTQEFVVACVSRIDSDINETAADIEGILDAGVSEQ